MLRDLLNQSGNARDGDHYRKVQRNGRMVHDYAHGPDVAVGPAPAGVAFDSAGSDAPAPADSGPGFQGATTLAGILRGAHLNQQDGQRGMLDTINQASNSPAIERGGDVGGGALHTTQQGPRQGQISQHINIGGRKFHIYFSPDGKKQVIELKPHPQE